MTSKVHDCIKDGWFYEVSDEHFPGQALALRVEEVLHHSKSEFQDILVFRSTNHGVVLVLDGIIQCSERDEFAYQEMIAHIPLYCHKNPKKVLVIGGGDGGVVREVVKHEGVESVTMVEIDKTVIELAEKYLPGMSSAMNHPKLTLKLCDGFKFLKDASQLEENEKFDVIITDSSDPDGPAEAFFQTEYFQLLQDALKPDGIVIAQTSENVWLDINYLKNLSQTAKSVFRNARICYTTVPTYTSGQLGLIVCCNSPETDLTIPQREPTKEELENLKYYNNQIHTASFVLPNWADNLING
ncbi:Spermine synthase SPE4 [Nakaseomyces bracarensis]|uniref:Spermine synthase SPE4 n=1 Tax=Nakaseomyces bracarensis TaxID=273131 RepID=A0ABR4NRT7_9SACH